MSNDRCTLQLPYVDSTCITFISRHHATLRYNQNAREHNGIGLAEGHFNTCPQEADASVDCPCQLPNPHGKTCSSNGTLVFSYPPAGKERRVIMRKRIRTAAEGFDGLGGFVESTVVYYKERACLSCTSCSPTLLSVYLTLQPHSFHNSSRDQVDFQMGHLYLRQNLHSHFGAGYKLLPRLCT